MELAYTSFSRSGKTIEPVRVCIADDHRLVRRGLREILAAEPDIEVAQEAAGAHELFVVLQLARPHVLLLDLTMPGLSGTELIRELTGRFAGLRILVLSMHNEAAIAAQALYAGALGYVTKDADPDVLVAAIRSVARGSRFLDPALAETLAKSSLAEPPHAALSQREWQVLRGIVAGQPLSAIAAELHLSPKTVSSHKTRLMQKLGVASTIDLVRYAMAYGLSGA